MEKDELKVKKEAEQELRFHYDREKRMSLPGAPDLRHRGKRGIFKKNPSLKIILLDVLVIVLLSLGVRFLVFYEKDSAKMEGYRFTLETVLTQEQLIAIVVAEALENQSKPVEVSLFFRLKGDSEGQRRSLELPADKGGQSRREVLFDLTGQQQKVLVNISMDGKEKELSKSF